eukprot:TRINITY_DN9263_c0_g1_i1.p1 TRINITY_DN9263_c0_g1~~TRINITY_DN9263_c0_g1_i1.p1  ORF type:complete len:408 (-),score=65.74 TRINITY_DN9263_c0_g1_i1:3-1226(-)
MRISKGGIVRNHSIAPTSMVHHPLPLFEQESRLLRQDVYFRKGFFQLDGQIEIGGWLLNCTSSNSCCCNMDSKEESSAKSDFNSNSTESKRREKMGWVFTKEELCLGLSSEEKKTEDFLRRSSCAFIQEAGTRLRFPQWTTATAMSFLQRFYLVHSFKEFDRFAIGITCLFLAGKVEETPKKLKEVIEITFEVKNKHLSVESKLTEEEFNSIRASILTNELLILQTLAFDLTVEHPYKFLLGYVKTIKGDNKLAQVAWNFVNDSLRTNLCLQFRPQLVAAGAIFLATKYLRYKIPEGRVPWWELFDAKLADLEEISQQILELYPTDILKNNESGEGKEETSETSNGRQHADGEAHSNGSSSSTNSIPKPTENDPPKDTTSSLPPLRDSSLPVSDAVPRLSPGISHLT